MMVDEKKKCDKIHINELVNKAVLHLREEELEIIKNKIQTGELNIYKKLYKEEKTITVPVMREELIIENTLINTDGENMKNKEIIRIPIMEEQIEVHKQPVFLNEISIHKNQYQDVKHIEETVKKEILHITSKGNPIIIDRNK